MACFFRKVVFRKFLCCCDIKAENVCCMVGCICFFISFNHLCNFIPFFCLLTAVPHCLIMLLMALAGGLLIAGAFFDKPILLALFPWVMVACILLQVVSAIILYVSDRCISSVLGLLFGGITTSNIFTGVIIGYTFLGVLGGINFLFSLYSLLLVSCLVTEIAFEVEGPRQGCSKQEEKPPPMTICEDTSQELKCRPATEHC